MKIDIQLGDAPVEGTGTKSQISWNTVSDLLGGAQERNGGYMSGYVISGFTASEQGLIIHWEYRP